MRILLVEPDKVLARTYAKALALHDVIVAHGAADAIATLDDHDFDLVVLELQLGKHNGVELLYELRSYTDLQSVPVVLHTFVSEMVLGLSADVLKGLGVLRHLYKPATSLKALRRAISELSQPVVI